MEQEGLQFLDLYYAYVFSQRNIMRSTFQIKEEGTRKTNWLSKRWGWKTEIQITIEVIILILC